MRLIWITRATALQWCRNGSVSNGWSRENVWRMLVDRSKFTNMPQPITVKWMWVLYEFYVNIVSISRQFPVNYGPNPFPVVSRNTPYRSWVGASAVPELYFIDMSKSTCRKSTSLDVEKSTSILMETLKNLKIDIGDVDFLDVENQHQDVEK